ncbi:MAG: creatininase family protein [Acetobacteraceae bacterium]
MHVVPRMILFVGVALRFGFPISSAFAAPEVALEKMTWPEIARAIQNGDRTVIIPIGGTEQSGPFIAVGKHNVRAAALALRIARGLGHCLVAPVITYVPEGDTSSRTPRMRFPGTISIPPQIFEGMLVGAAESLRAQGFKRIAIISDHGSYRAFVARVTRQLNHHWQGAARIIDVTPYYDVLQSRFVPWLRERGFAQDIGQHADLMDASLMLAVDLVMVRLALMKKSLKSGKEDGVYGGDPRPSTAALGAVGTSFQVDTAIARLRRDNK